MASWESGVELVSFWDCSLFTKTFLWSLPSPRIHIAEASNARCDAKASADYPE